MHEKRILLGHGSGGKLTHSLIQNVIVKRFGNPVLNELKDSGIFNIGRQSFAFTTDSYVVNPIFFPGGDIGKLAVCGTVNDLSVCGAKPRFISCAFIIEEGLDMSVFERISESVRKTSKEAGVEVVTGDTKVVERGSADKLFINTSGVGSIKKGLNLSIDNIKTGDDIIINGSLGDHGISVLSKREGMAFRSNIKSDCAPLNNMIFKALETSGNIRFMRDATRGGAAAILNEIVEDRNFGIILDEKKIPIKNVVKSACEILGMDPLYIGNEGKVIIVSLHEDTSRILAALNKHKYGRKSRVIGKVTRDFKGKVCIRTETGGLRLVDMPVGLQLPRIC